MENTRLLMLEGLPGTGKSTNAQFLSMQLAQAGKTARWIHEVARPHPVLFFDEACMTYEEYRALLKAHPRSEPILNRIAVYRKKTVGMDLLELEWKYASDIGMDTLRALRGHEIWDSPLDAYVDAALDKWAWFADQARAREDEVTILDSSLFQFQIFTFLLRNAPYAQLESFVQKLIGIVRPLNPALIYLYREDARDTIDFLEGLRGKPFMEWIWERDRAQPYYHDKPAGAEGHRRFLLDYAEFARRLFSAVDCRKIAIEIGRQDWRTYEDEMLAFVGAQRKAYPNVLPPNGIFRNEVLGLELEVDGLSLKDPYAKRRSLTPKSSCDFDVECLPTVLHFHGQDQIEISGEQICERWTTIGTRFIRV